VKRTILPSTTVSANLLTTGEETFPRDFIAALTLGTNTGTLRLSYLTARKSETTTQIRVLSGSTSAAATPTLVRIGLFSIAGNGDGTLVAATTSDTALFAAANTRYTKSWASSYAKVAGQRYAVGILVVTSATAPSLAGVGAGNSPALADDPRLTASIASQTDLPASFTAAALAVSGTRFYAALLP
jgi:hypothetical protein